MQAAWHLGAVYWLLLTCTCDAGADAEQRQHWQRSSPLHAQRLFPPPVSGVAGCMLHTPVSDCTVSQAVPRSLTAVGPSGDCGRAASLPRLSWPGLQNRMAGLEHDSNTCILEVSSSQPASEHISGGLDAGNPGRHRAARCRGHQQSRQRQGALLASVHAAAADLTASTGMCLLGSPYTLARQYISCCTQA